MALEEHVAEQDIQIRDLRNKVDFFVRSSLPPVEGIFYDGQIFDAYAHIIGLIKQAKTSITLIDNYINVDTLTMLSNRAANVSATIYTRQLSQQQQLDLQRHNQQYPPIHIRTTQRSHDRFLIIDDVVYIFGASLKDAGKKLFAYIRMQETPPSELLRTSDKKKFLAGGRWAMPTAGNMLAMSYSLLFYTCLAFSFICPKEESQCYSCYSYQKY